MMILNNKNGGVGQFWRSLTCDQLDFYGQCQWLETATLPIVKQDFSNRILIEPKKPHPINHDVA